MPSSFVEILTKTEYIYLNSMLCLKKSVLEF